MLCLDIAMLWSIIGEKNILSYLILSYLTLPYLTLPYLTLPYLTLPYLILSYLILSYLILSYLILSYLILSYLILSYLILQVLNLEDFVKVRERSGIKLDIKLKFYKAVELSTLLYTCKTWTIYQRLVKILNHFHLRYLTEIVKNSMQKQDRRHRGPEELMHTDSKLAQLRWTGHFIRMPDERLPKKVFTENYRSESALKVARKQKPLKATLKASPNLA